MITYNELMAGKTAFTKALELKPKTVRVDKDNVGGQGYNGTYLVEINDAPLFDTLISCDVKAIQLKEGCYDADRVWMFNLKGNVY